MRIMYLTDQIYLHGGVEKVLSQKTGWLADVAGDEVWIVTSVQNGKKPVYPFSSKIHFEDLGVNYEIEKSYFHPDNIKKARLHYQKLKETVNRIKPDIIVSCNYAPDFYFIPAVAKNIPTVKEYHTTRHFYSQGTGMKQKIMDAVSDRIEKKYCKLVLLNEDEVKFYRTDNITIIPNPTDADERRCSLEQKKIVAAGRISPQKNFGDFVDIWKLLPPGFEDWQLHIYGNDYLDNRRMIQERIDAEGLQNNIKFMGASSDMKQTFMNYSVYAMCSVHETFPMVLLEALTVGLPVVSYNCPTGPDRIVTSGEDGWIVPYLDRKAFAESLANLMKDEALRKEMGKMAAENANRFDINTVMQQWKSLFDELITENKKR